MRALLKPHGGYVHSGEWKTGGIGKTAEIRASGGIPERKE